MCTRFESKTERARWEVGGAGSGEVRGKVNRGGWSLRRRSAGGSQALLQIGGRKRVSHLNPGVPSLTQAYLTGFLPEIALRQEPGPRMLAGLKTEGRQMAESVHIVRNSHWCHDVPEAVRCGLKVTR
jgi:hypothetical protein